MENKKFKQNLNQEDLIAYNYHLIDQKNKTSIMIPLLGLFMAGMGVFSLFQEDNNIVSSIIYIVLGLFAFFFLKKIMAAIQKKSVRKHITNNFSKVEMEVSILEEGIRFEIIDDEEEIEEKKTEELSNDELRELERYHEEEKIEGKTEEKKEEEVIEEDYIPVELPENFEGVYEGIFNNENYLIDISKKGIYITVNDNKEKIEIVAIEEESIKVNFKETECVLIKKEIKDPNSLLKFISSDESIYVNLGKVAQEGETPKQEETVEEEKIANALTIPWGGMAKVEEEENYIFINMLGYEAMIMKKSDCEEIEEVIEYIKEKLGDEKKYIVVENKK